MTIDSEEYRFTKMKRELARRYLKKGNYAVAESELREALQHYPSNVYVIYDLAELCHRSKRRGEAKEFLQLILSRAPQHSRALLLMGKILHHEKSYPEALQFLKNSLAAEDMEWTRLALVNLYIDMDREEEALPYIQTALEKNPEKLPFLKALARIHKKRGDTEMAIREYEKIIRQDPADDFAYSEYISLKTSSLSEGEAIRQMNLVMKTPTHQKNVYLMVSRSFKLKKLKKYEEAASQLRGALALDPENDYIRQQLGYLFNTMKKYEETQHILTSSLFRNPKDTRLRKTLVAAANKVGTEEALRQLLAALEELLLKNPGMKNLWGDIKKTEKKLNK